MSQTTTLRALASRQTVRPMSRRQMMGRTLAGTLGLAHAACATSAPEREHNLSVYSWAEYHAPENVRGFATSRRVGVTFDFFDSNEAMLAKLELAGTSSGYDLVVPNLEFVPLLVKRGVLQPLDRSRIPNWGNQDPAMVAIKDGPGGDPGGQYVAIKDWGTTGFVYDRKAVPGDLRTWADFARAAASTGASGRVSVLPSPLELLGLAQWREEASAKDSSAAALARAESWLVTELAPHIKAFDGYPALGLLNGDYVLSQCWNGDARKALIEDPDRFQWALGAPVSNMWVATYAVTANCANPETAHAFIDYMLNPEVSAKEIAFTGNDTAIVGAAAFLPPDLPARDLIFLPEAQRERLIPSTLTDAQPRMVEIFNRVKVAASRG